MIYDYLFLAQKTIPTM